jgi:hypothetical protein
MTIKDFNEMVENDYWNESIQSIDPVSDNWFPLMKYDEEYGLSQSLDNIRFVSLGLNPSLTTSFSQYIHSNILEVRKQIDFKNELKYGQERYEFYTKNKSSVINKLIDYQARLKYNDKDKEQIQYFSHLTSFFKEIDKNISFKNHVFHYDFCQLRCTDSKEMLDVLNSNYKLLAHHLLKIIDIVKPEIIFVFNAFLSKLLIENDFFSIKKIDKANGCYFLKGSHEFYPKIILANQLSGGATSIVYRDLLVWNTQRILGF